MRIKQGVDWLSIGGANSINDVGPSESSEDEFVERDGSFISTSAGGGIRGEYIKVERLSLSLIYGLWRLSTKEMRDNIK